MFIRTILSKYHTMKVGSSRYKQFFHPVLSYLNLLLERTTHTYDMCHIFCLNEILFFFLSIIIIIRQKHHTRLAEKQICLIKQEKDTYQGVCMWLDCVFTQLFILKGYIQSNTKKSILVLKKCLL